MVPSYPRCLNLSSFSCLTPVHYGAGPPCLKLVACALFLFFWIGQARAFYLGVRQQDYESTHLTPDPQDDASDYTISKPADQGSSLVKLFTSRSHVALDTNSLTPDPLPRTRVLRIMDQGSSLVKRCVLPYRATSTWPQIPYRSSVLMGCWVRDQGSREQVYVGEDLPCIHAWIQSQLLKLTTYVIGFKFPTPSSLKPERTIF